MGGGERADFLKERFFFGCWDGLFGWHWKKDAPRKNNMTVSCQSSGGGGGILDQVPLTPPDTTW